MQMPRRAPPGLEDEGAGGPLVNHTPARATCLTREHRTNTESRFSRVMKLFVRGSAVWLMCCSSHSIGASAALKIFFTASATSGPMPSPGNSVAVMGAWLLKSLRQTKQFMCCVPLHTLPATGKHELPFIASYCLPAENAHVHTLAYARHH